ncbi:probable multidrug resistance-associated protein lethal(2)03659 isoform X1 [Zophobas morio]|uniref:probable multidrug resistance-associated protein lethal(2)03659 isoform X1 n=1 Tax=Zophobas morio TaxID=2755281 RepID=UPI003083D888
MDYLPRIKRSKHPQERANFISQLFFLYTASLFTKGYTRDLDDSDLYEVPPTFKSKKLAEQLDKHWQKQVMKQKETSIFFSLLKFYGLSYFLLGLSKIILKTSLIVIRPFVVEKFASFFVPHQINPSGTYSSLYGFSIIGLVLVECWYDQWYTFKLSSLEIQVRASLSGLFYRKCLRQSSLSSENIGKIINLLTKDVYNFEMCIKTANETWISTIQIIIISYILTDRIGYIVLILVLFLLILVPIQVRLAIKTTVLKLQMLEKTDDRFQTTKDILLNIRTIKMYAWEKFFHTKLLNLRSKEVNLTFEIFLLKFIININGIVWTCATFFIWMAIFIHSNEVTSEIVFFMFDSHRTIGCLLTITIPFSISQIVQTVATITRVDEFLKRKEISRVLKMSKRSKIALKNVSVVYRKESVLNDINLEFDEGLVLISGAPGSGKTFLLKTILGECDITRGNVVTEGSISYASQQPWLFPATIRQNIVFGEEFDEKRYNAVLTVCDLANDFQLLQNGDQTIIEDRINLSKGQCVRINLARALYKESDIYLLDDPLMALDPYLKEYVFKACVRFLDHKLVVLVMQDPTDFVGYQSSVVLDNGKITSNYNSQMKIIARNVHDKRHMFVDDELKFTDNVDEETQLLPTLHLKNIYKERNKVGEVECKVYKKWMEAGGGILHFLLVAFFLVFLPLTTNFLEGSINLWAINEEKIANYTRTRASRTPDVTLLMRKRTNSVTLQILFILLLLVLFVTTSVGFLNFAKRVSLKLHDLLAHALINVNLHFFNTSVAEILNKISRDFLNIDEIIPFLFYDLSKLLIPLISPMIFIVPIQKIFLVPLVLLIFILTFIRKMYLTIGRSLKRLEASSKTPMVGHFSAMLSGLTTVKSQKCEQKVLEEFDNHLDLQISASFTYMSATRAFSLAVGWTSTIFLGIVISRFFVVRSDPLSVTFTIFQTLLLIEISNAVFLTWAEIETHMTSVERVLELTQVRQECPANCMTEIWSKPGYIKFHNVCLYETISNNVSFVIHPKEKIGVVGRSGSGKSALISTLFKLENFDGQVFVNGVDLKTLPPEYLRSKISSIPQDVTIFEGTIKENLDPFNKYPDSEIWDVLQLVNLKKFVWDLNVNVNDTYIVGRVRQILLCLAKVILEKNEIVVFDEFLVNIGDSLRNLVCNLIQTVFVNSTMIIVTHDLHILSCCNKVMVLDEGRIVDFRTFSRLSRDEEGIFFQMLSKKSKEILHKS